MLNLNYEIFTADSAALDCIVVDNSELQWAGRDNLEPHKVVLRCLPLIAERIAVLEVGNRGLRN